MDTDLQMDIASIKTTLINFLTYLKEVKTELQEVRSYLKELKLWTDKAHIVHENGFVDSERVQQILHINGDTLGRMRAKEKIQFIELSNQSFRYKLDQPIFRGENVVKYRKMNRLKKALQDT